MLLWAGCLAGALEDKEYSAKLAAAGFTDIGIEVTRVHKAEEAREWFTEIGVDYDKVAPQIDGKTVSSFIRAEKPRD